MMPEEQSPSQAAPAEKSEPRILQGAERFGPAAEAPEAMVAPRPAAPAPAEAAAEKSSLAAALESLLASVVIALFIISFAVQTFEIPSESMENTLLIGDYLLVDKADFGPRGAWPELLPYAQPQRGEVVVFHYPVNPHEYFVKRIIAVPGDRIRIVNQQVVVNGKRLNERAYAIYLRGWDSFGQNFPPVDDATAQLTPPWAGELRRQLRGNTLLVPPGDYFVMGDNREDSSDSRYWGFVPAVNIVGRPLLIYFSVGHGGAPGAAAGDGKLAGFGYALEKFWRRLRWQRLLQRVH